MYRIGLISNKFWKGKGGRVGWSSVVMLLNHTSAVRFLYRTVGVVWALP
jgi:hypothetical protein